MKFHHILDLSLGLIFDISDFHNSKMVNNIFFFILWVVLYFCPWVYIWILNEYFIFNILNKSEVISLRTSFQVLYLIIIILFNIQHFCIELNIFRLTHRWDPKRLWHLRFELTCKKCYSRRTPHHQISRTVASSSYSLVLYLGHTLLEFYSSALIHSAYSKAPTDWTEF